MVATGGCFDVLHAGHIASLRGARALGGCLIVCLNSDDSVRRLKGPSRPLVTAADRARVLEALEFVDAVVVFDEDTPTEVLDRPDPPASGNELAARLAAVRARHGTIVATGGCFDLLHAGHIETLRAARALGDFLVVCLNSDASVARLKGQGRPIVSEHDRIRVLAALEFVDAVVVFDEETPTQLLRRLRPDVWVKGGDYDGRALPEAAVLTGWGGQAVVVPYLHGRSTTALVHAAANRGGAR